MSDVPIPAPRWPLPLFLFVSGACGLAYEVAWARYLALFLGSTATAHTVVLGTFMGGLALGAWAFGRRADRSPSPLRLYAWLELLVAATCIVLPLLVRGAGAVYVGAARLAPGSPAVELGLRIALAVGVIAVPAVLLGGTLPAASRYWIRSLNRVGSGVATLYFLNSLGAVFGALIAGFVLVPGLGLDGTLWVAAAGNIAVGLAALRLARRPLATGLEELLDADAPAEQPWPQRVAAAALLATALSGAAAMIYEVTWIRLLTLLMGGTTYAFTVMLAAFILGIAVGSALVSVSGWGLSRGGLGAFAALELAVAVVVLAFVPLYERLPYLYLNAAAELPRVAASYPMFQALGFATCVAVMLVPTALLGATFPLAARLVARSVDALGGGVGRAYAFNTAGTLAGTVAAGHLLFPWIGLQGALVLGAALNAAAGVACLWAGSTTGVLERPRQALVAGGVALSLFVGLAGFGPRLDRSIYVFGLFRALGVHYRSWEVFRDWHQKNPTFLYDVDGADSTITVYDYRGRRVMSANGKPDASTNGDMPTQLFVGHLPMLLHAAPKKVFVVGLGSGATSAAVLAHPEAEVTTVELSPEIAEAARLFADANRDALDHPRHRVEVGDARARLLTSSQRWDVIVSEPSNPWVAGNAGLFTREFFELLRARLGPGGVAVQWFQGYEITDEAVRTILRTFVEVFPEMGVFHGGQGRDFFLIGFRDRAVVDPARIEQAIADSPLVREDLELLGIRSAVGVYARHLLDPEAARTLAGPGRLHTDTRPVLDFQAARGLFLGDPEDVLAHGDLRADPTLWHRSLLGRVLAPGESPPDAVVEEVLAGVVAPFEGLRGRLLEALHPERREDPAHRRRVARAFFDAGELGDAALRYQALERSGDIGPEDRWRLWFTVAAVAQGEEVDPALARLEEAVEAVDRLPAWEALAAAAGNAGRPEVLLRARTRVLDLAPEDEPVWERAPRLAELGEAQRLAGDPDAARESNAAALELLPGLYLALRERWILDRDG